MLSILPTNDRDGSFKGKKTHVKFNVNRWGLLVIFEDGTVCEEQTRTLKIAYGSQIARIVMQQVGIPTKGSFATLNHLSGKITFYRE